MRKNPDAIGKHGRQPGTLKSLAENRKKQAEKARIGVVSVPLYCLTTTLV
jgi:hypothetical protein